MMNKAENEAGNRAIDSLINYETVKVSAIILKHQCQFLCNAKDIKILTIANYRPPKKH